MTQRLRSTLAALLLLTGIAAMPAFAATEPVTWTAVVSASTGAGGAIAKTAGPSWYAAASGARALSGDGRFEFRVTHTGVNPWVNAMTVCLNAGTANVTDGASLEHCIVAGAGYASVYERGRWTTDIPISTSDLLGIGVVGGSVRYYRNGTAFHTSSLAPAFPVAPYFATSQDGYGLSSASLTTATPPPPQPPPPQPPPSTAGAVTWGGRVATIASGAGGVTKVAATSWYGAATSEQQLSADGRYEFQVTHTGVNPYANAMQVCLDSGAYDVLTPASLDHCVVIGAGYASAYVAGRWSSDTPITTADRLAIGIEGGVVRFYKNGTAYYTSGSRPVFPARAVFLTSFDGYGLTNASVTGGSGTTPPPPGNRPPTIAGPGTRTIAVGEAYSFTPTAADPDGDRLAFSVAGRPAWLAFDVATGRLSGTPAGTNVGAFPMTISVSDGSLTASLALTVTVAAANRAPTISGPASASVLVGQSYTFTPTASDPDGQRLSFTASGLPAWVTFDPATGRVSGTPSAAHVGSSTVRITASDGALSASLTYTLAVVAATNGRATLSWTPPLTRADGSTLTNLAGYRVYYGTSSGSLTQRIVIGNPSVSTWLVENLTPGTWWFAVTAVDAAGLESTRAGPVSTSVN